MSGCKFKKVRHREREKVSIRVSLEIVYYIIIKYLVINFFKKKIPCFEMVHL